MDNRQDLFTFTICTYCCSNWGLRRLGPKRYALDVRFISFQFEFWWLR